MWILCPQDPSCTTPRSLSVGCLWWPPSKEYSTERGQRVSLEWRTWQILLSQVFKVNVNRKGHFTCDLNHQTNNPSNHEKTSDNRGAPYKVPEQCTSKLSRSSTAREVWDTVTAKGSLKSHGQAKEMCCAGRDPGQKMKTRLKKKC